MKPLLSIDVEDWFQVENLKQAITRESWGLNISRIERNINLILGLLNERNTKATFFVLGWIAERYPSLIRLIYDEGHEIGCHGYNHDLIFALSKEDFYQDVYKAKSILENITGEKVIGYRAPSFSITDWAIDTIKSLGFRYDSSYFPISAHNRYGKLEDYEIPDNSISEIRKNFFEVMLSYVELGKLKLPWAGGLYFRVIPYNIFKKGINNILTKRDYYLLYIHPWEFDPGQPRINNIKFNYRLRHYTNLDKTEDKFKKLICDFNFSPIRDILPPLDNNFDKLYP
jgi:polysaccharide deacetylase family protein (PEP-CTERM system associated)